MFSLVELWAARFICLRAIPQTGAGSCRIADLGVSAKTNPHKLRNAVLICLKAGGSLARSTISGNGTNGESQATIELRTIDLMASCCAQGRPGGVPRRN